jgi:hypothetical protein
MAKTGRKPKNSDRAEKPAEPEAALCEYELEARRENELRARRKRAVES